MKFKRPARNVEEVFLHHSGTDKPEHDNYEFIRKIHVDQNKWSGIGYHFFINSKGVIYECRDLEKIPAAQLGHNTGTIAICLSGVGSSFTDEQFKALRELCRGIDRAYEGDIVFRGHKEVNATRCPEYDYKSVLKLDDEGHIVPKNWWIKSV